MYREITTTSHTTLNINSESREPPVDPLAVEDGPRLVLSVLVVVPACLVVGAGRTFEHDGGTGQRRDVVWSLLSCRIRR